MIIISPYAKFMREQKPHPKNYPWWDKVIDGIDEEIIQVGIEGEARLSNVMDFKKNLKLDDLKKLVDECKTWISIDSFFQHFCWDIGKPGVVIFAQSDPKIFGHPENTNLLKDRKYLREKQFWIWEQADFKEESFVSPDVVLDALKKFNVNLK